MSGHADPDLSAVSGGAKQQPPYSTSEDVPQEMSHWDISWGIITEDVMHRQNVF